MQIKLIVANEQHKGREIPVNVPKFLIGRAEEGNNLRLRSKEVSRHHCTILVSNGTAVIEDGGGENGTYVNGNRITAPHTLKNGDKLTIGAYFFVVSITDAAEKSKGGQGDFVVLTPAQAPSSDSESSSTAVTHQNQTTVAIKPKEPMPTSEVMFEVRLDGQRISVTKSRLFDLAKKGSVLPDDLITVAGTKVFADSIQGIVFGNQSSASPPPVPNASSASAAQPPVAPTRTSPTAAEPNMAFPDFGDVGDVAIPFDDIATGPVIRVGKKEKAFSAIWNALDISFSRVYSTEGNNLAIHCLKGFYYIIVLTCLLGIFWLWFEAVRKGVEAEAVLATISAQLFGLILLTIVSLAVIVVVRVLMEMLLLAWLESSKPEERDTEE